MELRPIEEKDNPAVAELIRRSLKEFGLDKPGTAYFDPQLDNLADYYSGHQGKAFFVLEDQGEIVGCGGFEGIADGIAELQKLYLAANSRGKGYSSRILKRIFEEARTAGFQQLYLETTTALSAAVAVYQHYGFELLDKPIDNGARHSAMDIWMINTL